MTNKPNILILMVDQLNGQLFADGPADFLQVPTLRKLHSRGVNFSNTYCASPLCSPARASFMCGSLPSANGVYDNAAEFVSSLPTFAHSLRALGYQTILSGKMHFVGADQLHGFEERLTTDIYPADFGWTPDWRKPNERIDWWYHNLGSVTGAGIAATSNQLEFDDEVAYHAKLKLHQLARRDDDQPFCLTVSFTHPHDPYVTRQKYWDLYENVEIPEVQVPRMSYADQDPHSRRLYEAVDYQNFAISPEDVTQARRAYCANISYLDEKMGEILATLEECQLSDETIVIFTADHGDMIGERGLWYKMSFFEGSMRVPLLMHAPQRFANKTITEPVSVLDLVPTLIELGGGTAEDQTIATHGRSLLDCAEGNSQPQHPVLAEYAAEGSVDPMLMIREGEWKFNYCEADPPQLFNLQQDPLELNNLAEDPDQQTRVQSFTEQVHSQWDLAAFRQDVLDSQRNRLTVYQGLRQGSYQPWDFQPSQDATERYMRNHLDLNVLESQARFPREK
ncbi:MAG: choline-sulfatase [Pseudomonadota bacterium]